jgi:hypothetical protein
MHELKHVAGGKMEVLQLTGGRKNRARQANAAKITGKRIGGTAGTSRARFSELQRLKLNGKRGWFYCDKKAGR